MVPLEASMSDPLQTRGSLLARLKREASDTDWEQFYRQYGNVILSFCSKQGLDEFAARDVLQEVMLLLMRKLPSFDYNPARGRFRNWLLALVMGKIRDAHRRARRLRTISIDERSPHSGECFDESLVSCASEASQAVEKAWLQALIEEALRKIQNDPKSKRETFAVFYAYVIESRPVAEVAQQFGVAENTIYQIKNRILKRLREELAEIIESGNRGC